MRYKAAIRWNRSLAMLAACIMVLLAFNTACQHPAPTTSPTTPSPMTTSVPHLTAQELFDEYQLDRAQADLKYKDKTIQVTGVITDVSDASHQQFSMSVNGGAVDFFASSITSFVKAVKGEKVTAQGLCQGISPNGNPSLAYVSIVS